MAHNRLAMIHVLTVSYAVSYEYFCSKFPALQPLRCQYIPQSVDEELLGLFVRLVDKLREVPVPVG